MAEYKSLELALDRLSDHYGDGIYTLPDGSESTLYDVPVDFTEYDGPVLVEFSNASTVVLTAIIDGYREESLGRVEFNREVR